VVEKIERKREISLESPLRGWITAPALLSTEKPPPPRRAIEEGERFTFWEREEESASVITIALSSSAREELHLVARGEKPRERENRGAKHRERRRPGRSFSTRRGISIEV